MQRLRASGRQACELGERIVRHPANRAHPVRALTRAGWWQLRKRAWPTPVDTAFEGYVLRCHRESSSASNVWYFTARYDHPEMTFLDRYVRPGDTVLDVGANIGTYSLYLARRVGASGRVFAVEAEPKALGRLRHNIGRNHLGAVVEVLAVAVDEAPGSVSFLVDLDVANGIAPVGDTRGRSVEVPSARLDDLVEPTPALSVAKLDVEGVEVRALAGASRLLGAASPPVWITEVLAPQLRRFGATVDDLVGAFAAHGFAPYRYDVDRNVLQPLEGPIKGNALFVAEARMDEVRTRLLGA